MLYIRVLLVFAVVDSLLLFYVYVRVCVCCMLCVCVSVRERERVRACLHEGERVFVCILYLTVVPASSSCTCLLCVSVLPSRLRPTAPASL